jgi:Fur family ferric uptake transcriptional regulator
MPHDVLDWPAHARSVLDRAGYRKGEARNAILDLLASQSCALTAQEIEDELRRTDRAVARASIYRVLDQLAGHRLVQRLEVGQGVARYETIHPTGHHHHHLVCERCGRLVPFDDSALELSIEQVADRYGFRVDEHEIVLRGACPGCA